MAPTWWLPYLLGIGIPILSFSSVTSASPAATAERRQVQYTPNRERADAVKQAFRRSWDGYAKYAFPNDTLKPISGSYENDRNGWGASAVDALSTAMLMGEHDVVAKILEFVPTIDFDATSTEVSLFETTIRYLGGLVSAYDLLTEGGYSDSHPDPAAAQAVLRQATRLANNLKFAFDTPSGVPHNSLFFEDPPRTNNDETNSLATVGTLVLEWTRLSDLTGDPVFAQLTQKAESFLIDPKPQPLAEPFPGLVGFDVNITTGLFVNGNGGWGGGTDSFYEYLLKMYLYDPVRFASYKDRWVLAADSSIKYLASHPSTRPELTFLALYRNTTRRYVSQHLACFDGGNFILGGLTLNEPRYVEFGLNLTRGCRETYVQTATGIGPEIFSWQDSVESPGGPNNPGPNTTYQREFYDRAGFWIPTQQYSYAASYSLRPEVIESYYYAYRATGDPKYQEWAWEAFLSINATCGVAVAYSSVPDVDAPGGGEPPNDFQESFWFAETLKYSYMIHAEEAPWQVKADKSNTWVYNTEAHPVRVFGGPV